MVVCFSISRRIDARDAQIYADAHVCVCVWKKGGKQRREIYGGELKDNAIRSGQTRRIFRYLAASYDTGFWIPSRSDFLRDR